jgi:hypothetical protein
MMFLTEHDSQEIVRFARICQCDSGNGYSFFPQLLLATCFSPAVGRNKILRLFLDRFIGGVGRVFKCRGGEQLWHYFPRQERADWRACRIDLIE